MTGTGSTAGGRIREKSCEQSKDRKGTVGAGWGWGRGDGMPVPSLLPGLDNSVYRYNMISA
jgi:hypothetical protein